MLHGTQEGQFWLPDRPEHTTYGTLTVDERGQLELTTRNLLELGENGNHPRTVCGATAKGLVTLVGARTFNKSISSARYLPPEQKETWFCSYAFQSMMFEGDHLGDGIVSVEVELESLPDWAYEGRIIQLDRDNGVLSWSMEQPDPSGSWSLGELSVRHEVYPSGSGRAGRYRSINLTTSTSFVVGFNQPQSLTRVQDTVSSLQALVSVARGEAVAVERVYLTVCAGAQEQRLSLHYEPVLRPLNPAPKSSELFTMGELGGLDGIGKWLDLLCNQTHLKNAFLADRYRQPIFINDAINHLLLAHEAYERHTTKRVGRKMTVHRILDPALDLMGKEFLDWIGNREEWKKKINDVRIEQVAHLENYGSATLDGEWAYTVNRQLFTLIVVRILAHCGLSGGLLEEVVCRSRADAIVRLP